MNHEAGLGLTLVRPSQIWQVKAEAESPAKEPAEAEPDPSSQEKSKPKSAPKRKSVAGKGMNNAQETRIKNFLKWNADPDKKKNKKEPGLAERCSRALEIYAELTNPDERKTFWKSLISSLIKPT